MGVCLAAAQSIPDGGLTQAPAWGLALHSCRDWDLRVANPSLGDAHRPEGPAQEGATTVLIGSVNVHAPSA
jgi:hypothetical protein